MNNYWMSWRHLDRSSSFALLWPWWVTGHDDLGVSICAAVKAESEQAAKEIILNSYFHRPTDLQWLFVEEKQPGWSPFNSRFHQKDWMHWNND